MEYIWYLTSNKKKEKRKKKRNMIISIITRTGGINTVHFVLFGSWEPFAILVQFGCWSFYAFEMRKRIKHANVIYQKKKKILSNGHFVYFKTKDA